MSEEEQELHRKIESYKSKMNILRDDIRVMRNTLLQKEEQFNYCESSLNHCLKELESIRQKNISQM